MRGPTFIAVALLWASVAHAMNGLDHRARRYAWSPPPVAAPPVFAPSTRGLLKQAVDQWCTPPFGTHNTVANGVNIADWDTSEVTDMFQLFAAKGSCNPNITQWNTAKVTNFNAMFKYAAAFNQPIGGWNTARVLDMHAMFANASAFARPIGDWNTALVKDMQYMFEYADVFNHPIGAWNTSSVTDMSSMFKHATAFNQDIGAWNTSSVTRMDAMFHSATAFDHPIGWNTARVTNMRVMFYDASSFNHNIGGWNTALVRDMTDMFFRATAFNQNIGGWSTGSVTTMRGLFWGARAFSQPIRAWNTTSVKDMSYMFYQARVFNQNIGDWNTSSVTDMSGMFWEATAFSQPIGAWNTASVKIMAYMFLGATAFDQPIGAWNTASVYSMARTFYDASSFNHNIDGWDTARVRDMADIFTSNNVFDPKYVAEWDTTDWKNGLQIGSRYVNPWPCPDKGYDGNGSRLYGNPVERCGQCTTGYRRFHSRCVVDLFQSTCDTLYHLPNPITCQSDVLKSINDISDLVSQLRDVVATCGTPGSRADCINLIGGAFSATNNVIEDLVATGNDCANVKTLNPQCLTDITATTTTLSDIATALSGATFYCKTPVDKQKCADEIATIVVGVYNLSSTEIPALVGDCKNGETNPSSPPAAVPAM